MKRPLVIQVTKLPIVDLYITSGVNALLSDQTIPESFLNECLQRYMGGDWGNVCKDDWKMNDDALEYKDRILASYIHDESGTVLWIITDAGHVTTTVLLPSEY